MLIPNYLLLGERHLGVNNLHLCVDSALHRGTSTTLSPGILLFHCYYSASYLNALFCPGGVTGPTYADCFPTAPSFLCGWFDSLGWSPGCTASDASGLLCSISLSGLKTILFDRGWAGSSSK